MIVSSASIAGRSGLGDGMMRGSQQSGLRYQPFSPVCPSVTALCLTGREPAQGAAVTQDPDAIDPRNNRESRLAEESASQAVSRSSAGGAIFSGGRPADSVPGPDLQDGDPESGTGAGHPLDVVLINPADAEQAVPGDEGPEHPGQR